MKDQWLQSIRQEGASVSAVASPNAVSATASFGDGTWALKSVLKAFAFAASTEVRSNMRVDRYFRLHQLIQKMAETPEGHRMHVAENIKTAAHDIVGVLRENFDLDAPRVYPSDDDTLVLVWEEDCRERLLTIGHEDVGLSERQSGSSEIRSFWTEYESGGDLDLLFHHLSGKTLSATSPMTPQTV